MIVEWLQNDLRIALEHFVGLGNVLKDSYKSLYPSEKGVMIYGLLVAARRLESLFKDAEKIQKQFLINVTGVDLVDVRNGLLGVIGHLKQSDCDMGISMLRDNDEPLFDSERIVERENYTMKFPTKENDSGYTRARRLMIEDSRSHFEELDSIVKNIDNLIDNLQDDEKRIKHDKSLMVERLNKTRGFYREKRWNKRVELLINRAKGELKDKDNKRETKIEIIQSLLHDIVLKNTIGNDNAELAYINQRRGNDEKLAAAIVERRDKLTYEDMMMHFDFVESELWLTDYIETEQLREACSDYDGKLFATKAAKEFTTLIKPAVKQWVDFSRKINIALFYAALKDYGVVKKDEQNATLMAQYIKDVYGEDVSSDSITRPLRKCLGKSFCTFDDHKHGDFTDKEFEKYKDTYHRLSTILWWVLDRDMPHSDIFDILYQGITHEAIVESLDKEQWEILCRASVVLSGYNPKF